MSESAVPLGEQRSIFIEPLMTRTTAGALAGCLSLACVLASAVDTGAQERVIALRPEWVIDATGSPPLRGAVVLVRGRRIDAVGPQTSVKVPEGADVIDLPGQALLPGLIDTHSHLVNRSMYPSPFGGEGQRRAPASEQMVKMVRHARVQLLCGITTLRQVGEPGMADMVLKRAIDMGMHPGPRIIGGGEHIGPELDSADAIRKKIREYVYGGAEWIKMTHVDLTPTTAQIPPELLKAGIDEAHRLGAKVTVHAVGRWGSALRTAVEAGADNIEHARPLTEEMVKLMLKHSTTASLTPIAYVGWFPKPEFFDAMDHGVKNATEWMEYLDKEIADYRRQHPEVETQDLPFESPISNIESWRVDRDMYQAINTVKQEYRRAHELKLPFSLGLDARFGGQAWQLEFLVAAGISPMDSIRAATSVAATLIGYEDRLGTIEKGKLADLIAVQGNPLVQMRAMRQIRFVMKDGVRYDTLSWR
jgi:imidazolonepropionase-like amidohydrolase